MIANALVPAITARFANLLIVSLLVRVGLIPPVWHLQYSIVRTVIEGVDGVAHNAASLSVSVRTDRVGAARGVVDGNTAT
jgi:hypothetical protein